MVASRLVGPRGRVYGIDLTPAMVARARKNLRQAGVRNAQVVLACAEAMPYAAHSFDVVLSNGVLNLSPLKMQSFREIARVLKPGGRLQCADIVLQETLPAEVAGNLEAWSG
jgi:ubiquinone/menaquinone biosynthesis C-methylase UbiE